MRNQRYWTAILTAATFGVLCSASLNLRAETVGDRLWIWGHPAGVFNNSWLKPLGRKSTIQPVAGAELMGIKNMMFIGGISRSTLDESYRPFEKLDRVIWSLLPTKDKPWQPESQLAFLLAEKHKNVVGVILDDFFHEPGTGDASETGSTKEFKGSLTPAELRALRERPAVRGNRLPVMVVVYTGQVKPGAKTHLAEVDQICLWTWRPEDLKHLETNFAALERLAPGKTLFLGCYTYDFNAKKPIEMPLMKHQVELGYQWLKSGRIAGMIFLGTPNVDVGLEAVDWSRDWIRAHGNETLQPPAAKPAG